MKEPRIGLIGGMSWESTAVYYRVFHELLPARANPWSQPTLIIDSIDFGVLVPLMQKGEWKSTVPILEDSARRLTAAGASVIGIATNTFHKVYEEIQAISPIPVIDIRRSIANEMNSRNFGQLALFGTKYLYEDDFYIKKMKQLGIGIILPNPQEVIEMQRIIFEELTVGIVNPESREFMLSLARKCMANGADSIGLCCTEFSLLISDADDLPILDSTKIHVKALLKATYDFV